MTGPHTTQLDRDQLDDHNLTDTEPAGDDEDKENAPGAAATASEGQNNHIHITEQGF